MIQAKEFEMKCRELAATAAVNIKQDIYEYCELVIAESIKRQVYTRWSDADAKEFIERAVFHRLNSLYQVGMQQLLNSIEVDNLLNDNL